MAVLWLLLAWSMFWLGNQLVLRKYAANGLDFATAADYVSAFLYQPSVFLLTLLLAGTATAITKKILWDAVPRLFQGQGPIPYRGLGLIACAFVVAVQGYGYFPRLVLLLAVVFAAADAFRLLNRLSHRRRKKIRIPAGWSEELREGRPR